MNQSCDKISDNQFRFELRDKLGNIKQNEVDQNLVKITGQVRFVLTDECGNVKEDRTEENTVVTTGLGFIASRMKDATATAMTHMAIGSGAVAPALGNTTLGTELGRVALSSTNVAANVVTYAATFPAGTGTGAITEAGNFNAGAAGTMLNRLTFTVINKAVGDSLAVTWTVTIN